YALVAHAEMEAVARENRHWHRGVEWMRRDGRGDLATERGDRNRDAREHTESSCPCPSGVDEVAHREFAAARCDGRDPLAVVRDAGDLGRRHHARTEALGGVDVAAEDSER